MTCKLWEGRLDKDGYGLMPSCEGAHRWAYRNAKGLPSTAIKGLVIRHICDNRSCVNPEHLVAGTQRENIHDMIAKGRKFYGKGDTSPNHKITSEIAAAIRAENNNYQASIATKYGVSQSTVSRIKSGKIW